MGEKFAVCTWDSGTLAPSCSGETLLTVWCSAFSNMPSREGRYLPYPPADGTRPLPSVEPVNQWPQVWGFRAHAARFAHQLQVSMGHHTLSSMSEEDRLTIHQTLSRMIGAASRRYQQWADVSSTEVVDGGTLDEQPLWKKQQADYEEVDRKLCGHCDSDFYPVSMALKADLPAFERVNGHGEIYAPDRSTAIWQPELMELATTPYDEFYDELKVHFGLMIEHYLDVVGAQDRSG